MYKAATMDFSSLILPSVFTTLATTSSTLYSSSNQVDFIAKFPNCLIATYTIGTETHRTESMEWAGNLAVATALAWLPFASYNTLLHNGSTHETQFNCSLHLVHVTSSDQLSCQELFIEDFPLASMYPASSNELVAFSA